MLLFWPEIHTTLYYYGGWAWFHVIWKLFVPSLESCSSFIRELCTSLIKLPFLQSFCHLDKPLFFISELVIFCVLYCHTSIIRAKLCFLIIAVWSFCKQTTGICCFGAFGALGSWPVYSPLSSCQLTVSRSALLFFHGSAHFLGLAAIFPKVIVC